MKKILLSISIAASASLTLLMPTKQAFAASEAECAIWLCLPTGFPSGCGEAKKAFKKRVKKLKSPLPALTSCLSNDAHVTNHNGQQTRATYEYDNVAIYDSKSTCTAFNAKACTEYTETGKTEVRGGYCPPRADGNGCNNYKYIDIFIDGEKFGETYYW